MHLKLFVQKRDLLQLMPKSFSFTKHLIYRCRTVGMIQVCLLSYTVSCDFKINCARYCTSIGLQYWLFYLFYFHVPLNGVQGLHFYFSFQRGNNFLFLMIIIMEKTVKRQCF